MGVIEIFIFYFFKLLGLAPFTVKIFKINKININSNFSTSRSGLIYIVILILIIFPLSLSKLHLIKERHSTEKFNSDSLARAFRVSKISGGLIVLFIIWCSMIFSQKRGIKILTQLIVTDNGIKMYRNFFNLESSKWQISLIFALNFSLWIILCIIEYILYDNFHLWIFIMLPNFIINWYTMQYGFMLILLAKRFKNLNCAFIKLSKSRLEPLYITFDGDNNDEGRSIADNFYGLRQAYTMYSEVCKKISNYYSIPILFIMCLFSCEIVYYAYYAILPFLFEDAAQPIYNIIGLVLQILHILLAIVTVTRNVTIIVKEVILFRII